jgi:hypothetical protein
VFELRLRHTLVSSWLSTHSFTWSRSQQRLIFLIYPDGIGFSTMLDVKNEPSSDRDLTLLSSTVRIDLGLWKRLFSSLDMNRDSLSSLPPAGSGRGGRSSRARSGSTQPAPASATPPSSSVRPPPSTCRCCRRNPTSYPHCRLLIRVTLERSRDGHRNGLPYSLTRHQAMKM